MKVFIFLFFITHWTACIFFLVANVKNNSGDYLTWIDLVDPNDRLTNEQFYTHSFFWAFATISTVGYGDIYAVSEEEKLVAIFVMIVACGVFATMVGTMGAIFDKPEALISDFQDKIMYIDQFLVKNKVNYALRARIKKYIFFLAVRLHCITVS